MTDIDTVRWGDSATLVAPAGSFTQVTKMLCYATTPHGGGRPIAWAVLLACFPSIVTGDASAYTLAYNITVGCGASTIPFPQVFLLNNTTTPPYQPVTTLLTIPASNIMINATLASGAITAGSQFQIAAMAAPIMDPKHMAEMADLMAGGENARQQRRPEDNLFNPFEPERLVYHRPR